MRKILLTATLLLVISCLQAGVIIKGTWQRKNATSISLYRINHGRLEEVSSCKLGPDQRFGFYFEPAAAAIYVIGNSKPGYTDKYNFYLKPQDELSIAINDSSYVLEKASPENREMERWHNFIRPIEWKGAYFNVAKSTYVDFFPNLESKAAEAQRFEAKKTGNKQFDSFFNAYRRIDLTFYASLFLSTPRTAHPETAQLTDFYRQLHVADYTANTDLIRFPYGASLLEMLTRLEFRLAGNMRPDIATSLEHIKNDTLKGEIVLVYAKRLRSYPGYKELDEQDGKYILTDDQQARYKDEIARIAKLVIKPGTPAIDFRYPDQNGKQTALSDFKGKVVLVDVWATWCGPCKAELPYLKKLEEEMHEKDVVFMSVSVDVEKDHQKWKDFIVNQDLKGVQLFASGWTDITKFYEIKGIPRFMVFNKKGEIVNTNAPRPSTSELKLLLEEELRK
ncbi:TlpA disulfide reductase family protein [Chitinophaga sp. sic0106]|uniref:TlpA family protein disulfide reductase n=1 Tax=Chitinophaga sp. sic0106 TaxID=2854785 RepID=UPI001C45CF69|nr:TlpA disulfide reductase family protein [Chitinophaga sp. sic0106]MBV7533256.1 TlpA family protein disulfide reductase [Chitinophaga sp. sic0106]